MTKYPTAVLLLTISPLLLCRPAAVWVLAAAADDVTPAHRLGCQSRCGGVNIPYPFGIVGDHQCAIHTGFNVNCTRLADGTDRPFMGPFEVTNISVPDAKAWMKMNFSWRCYDVDVGQMTQSTTSGGDFTNTPFKFSYEDNKVFVIGCDTLAYLRSKPYIIGCYTTCYGDDDIAKNGSCSAGAGCCALDVPTGLEYLDTFFNEDYSSSGGCGYILVMEEKAFSYSKTYRSSSSFWYANNGTVPVVMDWRISFDTCERAQLNRSSYACVSNNSDCVNTTNGPGYRCKCLDGYQGNPYVRGGCIDIDECQSNNMNNCMARSATTCLNTDGSYICLCPPGKTMVNDRCMATYQKSFSLGLSIGIGVSSGTVLLLLVVVGIYITRKRKQLMTKRMKRKFFRQNRGQLLQQLVAQRADIAERMIMPLEELEKATNKFDKARKLGDGGHSTVYKGILSDLHVVAIKKSKIAVQREIDEFINEVAILSQISHINVVKLFGCCLETEVPLLVYEFVSNGTLYHHLHVTEPKSLAWNDRLRIATEIAKAIAYLHSAVSIPIIHRDIKSTNILLDDTLTSKVSDFGASRHVPFDRTGITTKVQGTIGYMDPTYYYTRRLTEKSDVYSFGVILIELLTRKKPFSYVSSEEEGLIAHFIDLLESSRLTEILDWQVIKEGGKQVEQVATLAATCVKLNPDQRPTMRQVEMTLESIQAMEHVLDNVAGEKLVASIRRSHLEGRSVQDMTRQYSLEEEYLLSSRTVMDRWINWC